MASNFNRVVVRVSWHLHGMLDFFLHPFPYTSGRLIMTQASASTWDDEIQDWLKPIVEVLWDKIPGLDMLIVENGCIRIFHNGVFPNEEIAPIIEAILKPIMEETLKTKKLLD